MIDLKEVYEDLLSLNKDVEGGFIVKPIPELNDHRLGITRDGQPIFFINCRQDSVISKLTGYRLLRIDVQFNKNCLLLTEGQPPISGLFTTIELKGGSSEVLNYFLNVVYLLLKSLPVGFLTSDLSNDLQGVISLFNGLSLPPKKSIQGLWAELVVIEVSKRPEFLISAWHRNNYDKFDFNDGVNKIEVKSTSRPRRIHRFSAEQLLPNKSSKLLIASTIAIETGIGSSIYDLVSRIEDRVKDSSLVLELRIKIALILGSSLEQASEIYFDYTQAVDSLSFFHSDDIPKIADKHIPSQIQRVSYDCDLTGISPAKLDESVVTLFAAL